MVSRETRPVGKTVFPKKLILSVSKGDALRGLSRESSCVFLLEYRLIKSSPVIACLKTYEESFSLYQEVLSAGGAPTFFFPEKNTDYIVPGFLSSRERYRQEVFFTPPRKNPIYITTKTGLREKNIPNKNKVSAEKIFIKVNKKNKLKKVIKKLISFGYKRVDCVYDPGTFRTAGDILDIYPLHFDFPIRCSFNFNTPDRLTYFNPTTQISTDPINRISIYGKGLGAQASDNIDLAAHVSGGAVFSLSIKNERYKLSPQKTSGKTKDIKTSALFIDGATRAERLDCVYKQIKNNPNCRVFLSGPKNRHKVIKTALNTPTTKIKPNINKGFYSQAYCFLVVSIRDVLKEKKYIEKWKTENQQDTQVFTAKNLFELNDGDFLVHKKFGIGIFRGLEKENISSVSRESIKIEYKNNSFVFVSIENLDLIHKYIGTSSAPVVSALGSKKWGQELAKTRKAVQAVAKEIIDLYAKKQNLRPFNYLTDAELEGALVSSFAFKETPDQKAAIDAVLKDMLKPRPMDRLVCGDVGFGKTEVAIRAIMRATISKKASIFLCPTTILADQHYITCKERLGSLGVRIELLSRFKTKKEQIKIMKKCEGGLIDLLIGTHRLLSPDVFLSSLGLLIIDEEHRFGVKHKEKIRKLKTHLDVISLSATPIPRTLQQSSVGLRTISLIQTPPISRKPIITEVRFFNWALINKYIEQELKHGGQTYFVHNDVGSLPFIAKSISKSFPGVSVEYIHGQMPDLRLEERVLSFFEGGVDVLVCTTIIESGLDVSNANCIIINNAQNFGLSQLYQMRGRVGRGERQARCLLTLPQKKLKNQAFQRLKTIEQYTSLGAGYDISIKDLEIRGAGSLFGYKQSGHISSVGFELYCDILKDELDSNIDKKKKLRFPEIILGKDALIPEHYIRPPAQRLGFYDRISTAINVSAIKKIEEELFDRFGDFPKETQSLIDLATVRAVFKNTSVCKVFINEDVARLELDDIKPYKSLDVLISAIIDWGSVKNFKPTFSKTKKENLIVVLRYSGFDSGMFVIKNFSKLF